MSDGAATRIPEILATHEATLLEEWLAEQKRAGINRGGVISDAELRAQSAELLRLLRAASPTGNFEDLNAPAWADLREMLAEVSRTRGMQGFSPKEVATFVFSLKKPLFCLLRESTGDDQD